MKMINRERLMINKKIKTHKWLVNNEQQRDLYKQLSSIMINRQRDLEKK